MSSISIHNTFAIEIKNGVSKMTPKEKTRYNLYVRGKRAGNYELILRKQRQYKNRSLEQNAYYWGVVLKLISEHTGFETDELHEGFLGKFSCENNEIGLPIIHRSKEMSTSEFSDYVNTIRDWAAKEFQMYIPEPNEEVKV